jgi:hypothetical protein
MADFYIGAADQHKGPDNPSSDYSAMLPYWNMVEAINGGAETIRAAGELYLPKMPNESADDYRLQMSHSPDRHTLFPLPYIAESSLRCGEPEISFKKPTSEADWYDRSSTHVDIAAIPLDS